MRYGLVTGFGRSGSKWLAHTLTRATLIRADHETIDDPTRFCSCHGRVEVNTYWTEDERLARFAMLYPSALIFHLVRDPRAVIRSAMSRRTGKEWGFEKVCSEWARRALYAQGHAHMTFSLERLTDPDDHHARRTLCSLLEVPYDPTLWQTELEVPQNRTLRHSFPAYEGWTADQREVFFAHCGEAASVLGYNPVSA